jgi:hypothetical protein
MTLLIKSFESIALESIFLVKFLAFNNFLGPDENFRGEKEDVKKKNSVEIIKKN